MPERESFSESAVLHVPLLLRTAFSYAFTIIALFRSIYYSGTSLLAVHHRLHWRTPIVFEITTVTGLINQQTQLSTANTPPCAPDALATS